jgi:hypothetical protein
VRSTTSIVVGSQSTDEFSEKKEKSLLCFGYFGSSVSCFLFLPGHSRLLQVSEKLYAMVGLNLFRFVFR